ncbi:MAG TPA: hypothetical protein VFH70_03620 [Acidimicrobiales bacterium]|nr:hypothetical protein [Acidimicrobiales bacterium]
MRNRFDGRWVAGFELASEDRSNSGHTRYRVRRLSDGLVLPSSFTDDEVRVTRRRPS